MTIAAGPRHGGGVWRRAWRSPMARGRLWFREKGADSDSARCQFLGDCALCLGMDDPAGHGRDRALPPFARCSAGLAPARAVRALAGPDPVLADRPADLSALAARAGQAPAAAPERDRRTDRPADPSGAPAPLAPL